MTSVAQLWERLQELDGVARSEVERVFRIEELYGLNEVPEALRRKVSRWCGGDGEEPLDAPSAAWRKAANQRVIAVHNLWTFETTNFNILRAQRPGLAEKTNEGPDQLAASCEGANSCDFCDAERLTSEEPFGRIRGTDSMTAGNLFKSAALHALVIWRRHHPHRLTAAEICDGFETADKWFKQASAWSARQGTCVKVPVMFWNTFRPSGASQIHPHMQLQLHSQPVAQGALLKAQSKCYRQECGSRSLLDDVASACEHLGLSCGRLSAARCWASLTPRVGGGELCVMGDGSADTPALCALAPAVAAAVRALRRSGSMALSVNAVLAPAGHNGEESRWFIRLSGRGAAWPGMQDAGSAELMGLAFSSVDPFVLAEAFRTELLTLTGDSSTA